MSDNLVYKRILLKLSGEALSGQKGFGIDFVRNYLNIDLFAGIGDSMNDYPMFEKTNPCFTFSYAPEVLQKKATQLVNSVAEAIQIML